MDLQKPVNPKKYVVFAQKDHNQRSIKYSKQQIKLYVYLYSLFEEKTCFLLEEKML